MDNDVWPKRLYALDVSRGIAALSVVLWHWQHFAYNGPLKPVNFDRSIQPLYELLKIFYEKGSLGVNYFYLLSGFIFFWLYKKPIAHRDVKIRSFCLQRFSRLYPLHFATLIVVALLQYLYTLKNSTFFVYTFNDPYHFILNLCFASQWGLQKGLSFNAPVWSVSIEILLYLFFFAVAYLHHGGIIFSFIVSFVSYVVGCSLNHEIFPGLSMFFWGGFVFHFTFLLSNRYRSYKKLIYSITILSWFLVFVDCYLFSLTTHTTGFGIIVKSIADLFPNYILFPASLCSLALAEITSNLYLKPISWIGDITYSSYLLHFPLELAFGLAVAYGVINSSFFTKPIFLLLFFSLLILLSHLAFVYFERPVQIIIRGKTQPSAKRRTNAFPLTSDQAGQEPKE
jgi:peptidoglycan/LPS O-acetylase OafA/YrhL